MSIEAVSYEELTIENVNENTKVIANAISDYFKDNWGVNELRISIDGNEYTTDEESLSDDAGLFEFCKDIENAKNVSFFLSSDNSGGLDWRRESSFIQYFNDDVKDYVSYKCIEYYDTDPGIIAYAFGKAKTENSILESEADFKRITDVDAWYSYTPEISLCADEEHPELHESIKTMFDSLYSLSGEEPDEDDLPYSDDWEDCNEILADRAIRVKTENLHKFLTILNDIKSLAASYKDIECTIELGFAPDDEGKDSFMAINTIENDDAIVFELTEIK